MSGIVFTSNPQQQPSPNPNGAAEGLMIDGGYVVLGQSPIIAGAQANVTVQRLIPLNDVDGTASLIVIEPDSFEKGLFIIRTADSGQAGWFLQAGISDFRISAGASGVQGVRAYNTSPAIMYVGDQSGDVHINNPAESIVYLTYGARVKMYTFFGAGGGGTQLIEAQMSNVLVGISVAPATAETFELSNLAPDGSRVLVMVMGNTGGTGIIQVPGGGDDIIVNGVSQVAWQSASDGTLPHLELIRLGTSWKAVSVTGTWT